MYGCNLILCCHEKKAWQTEGVHVGDIGVENPRRYLTCIVERQCALAWDRAPGMTNLLPDTVEVLDRLGHLTSTGEVANSGSAFILRWTAFVVGYYPTRAVAQ